IRVTLMKSSSRWHVPRSSAFPSSSRASTLSTSRMSPGVKVMIRKLPLYSVLAVGALMVFLLAGNARRGFGPCDVARTGAGPVRLLVVGQHQPDKEISVVA